MYNPSNAPAVNTQVPQPQRRQASARHAPMQVAADNRTNSHSASRQQQSGSNLNLIQRPTTSGNPPMTSNQKKMKLIRTRATGTTHAQQPAEKKQRLKSPNSSTVQGPSLDTRTARTKISQGRQQSLNLSSNQFLKSPATSAPQTTKNVHASNYRHQTGNAGPILNQDQFIFSASSPPVQINKQAIMMSTSANQAQQHIAHQAASRPVQGKQKDSLGHITASRRQKQSGLQINVDGCQSIVISSPSRGHVIASPQSKTNVPDNVLFYGSSQPPKNTMSSATQHNTSSQLESLNQISPKGVGNNIINTSTTTTAHSNFEKQAQGQQPRRQQQSALSKKQLRQKVVSPAHQQYQITPKGAQAPGQFDHYVGSSVGAPRSTKARSSQHFVKGRFIETSNPRNQANQNNVSGVERAIGSPTNQQVATMSTLEQQKKQQKQHGQQGYSPRADCSVDEASQMLFMQSPLHHQANRRSSNRLVSPSTQQSHARANVHSSYNNRGAKQQALSGKGVGANSSKQQSSALGFKSSNNVTGGSTTNTTLKIQNVRVYNETAAAIVGPNVGPATTKHETTQSRYAMRNNFLSPATGTESQGRPMFAAADRKEQMARHGQGSNLRHFTNQSTSSVNQSTTSGNVCKSQTKKRKLTLNQRSTVAKNGTLNNQGGLIGVTGNSSIRPLSGVVKGRNHGQQTYSLRTNVAYISALNNTNPQINPVSSVNSSQRQSTAMPRGKNIQILQTDSADDINAQQRVYSPNAAMNGRRDINQELQNLVVPQFYPQTTTNSTAPRYIQFSQPQPQQNLVSGNNNSLNATKQNFSQHNNTNNNISLMEEPEIGLRSEQNHMNSAHLSNSFMHTSQDQQQPAVGSNKAHMSSSGLSMVEQQSMGGGHPHYMSSNTQHTVGSLRRQSRQFDDLASANNTTSFEKAGSDKYAPTQAHTQQSKPSSIVGHHTSNATAEHNKSSPRTSEAHQLHPANLKVGLQSTNDIGGPLVIPNFAINLPQTTTAATAPKISSDSMLMEALNPISQNSKDINQKLQQRKLDSARRPNDLQTQNLASQPSKVAANNQVIVTHQLNPTLKMVTTTGNSQKVSIYNNGSTTTVPSLNFSSQQQSSNVTNQAKPDGVTPNSSRPSQLQQQRSIEQQSSARHQQQPATQRQSNQSNTQRSNPISSQRSAHNEAPGGPNGSQPRNKSNMRSTKQKSPAKERVSSRNPANSKPVAQLNQSSAHGSHNNLLKDSSSHAQFTQQIKFPMTPAKCLKLFGSRHLTEFEKTEILDFPQVYYFGEGVKKIQAQKSQSHTTSPKFGGANRDSSKNNRNNSLAEEEDTNFGYDDSKGNYRVVIKDHIAYRYEMVEHLGRGSFGVAIKCFDHKTQEYVAVKIIKNKKKYYYQAGVELKILQYLKDNDPDDTMNIIHMKDYVIFRKHLCITFELMSINLYEFLKLNDFEGLSLSLVRRFAIQLLYSLKFLRENDVIHCDLKPENILLKDPSKSGIKIIDFGSSCFQDERVYTYIQSRFYRAPEIILGIPYTPCIDMWSFGCIMAEFAMGYPIFPGEDETDQISLIMEVCGIPQPEVLSKGQRKTKFFNENNMPKLVPNSHGKVRKPGTKVLDDILECSDQSFVNFVERCLEWDPEKRMSPDEAIRHQWILEGLPPKVLVHHQKLHNISTKSLPPHIRQQRAEYLATQPLEVQEEFDDEDEDDQASSSSYQQHHGGRNARGSLANNGNPKSKSVDRSSAAHVGSTVQGNATASGQIANGQQTGPAGKYQRLSAHASQQVQPRAHRQTQSFDQTASGYIRHNTHTSANINAQQHHNQRQKKPSQTLKSVATGDANKPTVEQMLHGSQR